VSARARKKNDESACSEAGQQAQDGEDDFSHRRFYRDSRPHANEGRTVGRLCCWLKGKRIDRTEPCPYIAAMAVRDILIIPDKRLRLKSEPVKAADRTLRALIDDMFETMYAAPGIGLAAIQIGVPQRVVTMDLAKKDEPKQPQVFINPEVTWASSEKAIYEEGCLSIPEYYEEVERPKTVRVKYLDPDLKLQEIEADGLLATCLQHEIDHINGVLFIDHISKLKRDMVIKKFKKAAKKGEPAKPLAEDKEPSHHIG
jgi:peptide deformylase